MHKPFLFAVLLVLLNLMVVSPNQGQSFDHALNRLSTLEHKEFRDAVDSIYLALDPLTDYALKIEVTRRLFQITAARDEVAHIRSLCYLVIYSDTSRPALFDEAYRLAVVNDRLDLMDFVEDRRSRYYISRKKYDSATVHILRMRDIYQSDRNDETYHNILNLLGDVYYNTKLYREAENVYFNLFVKIVIQGQWNYWRPYVIMNNLGQIALIEEDYSHAGLWFYRSLSKATNNLHTSDRDNILVYSRLKIAETCLKVGNINDAGCHLDTVETFPIDHLFEDVRQELLFIKSRILLKKGRADDALKLALTLLPGDSILFNKYRFVPEIYLLLSEIYVEKEQYSSAFQHLQKYSRLNDSIESQGILARSMVIISEKNHEIIKKDLRISQQRNNRLMIFLAILAILLVGLLIMYRRLYLSKLALVRLSLINQDLKDHPQLNSNSVQDHSHPEILKLNILADMLTDLMEKEKPWLDPLLNIQQVARQMNTNRTYLSRAINESLNMNFSMYVNGFRIREAIRLIKSGFTVSHTQEALAGQCGFSSRTVFIAAFKKYTGVTPSFFIANYRKQIDNESQEILS